MNPAFIRFNGIESICHNVTACPDLWRDTDTILVPLDYHLQVEHELRDARILIESLADRLEICSRLLSKCAERRPPHPNVVAVHEAIRRHTTYEPVTLTMAQCRDKLAQLLGIKGEDHVD